MNRQGQWLLFICCSLLAHGLILFFMAGLSGHSVPPGSSGKNKVEARKQQTRKSISRERVVQATRQVRRISATRIEQKLQSLRKIEQDLAAIEARKMQEYDKSTEPLRQNAIENAKGAMQETLGLQQRAVADLQASSTAYDELIRQYDEMLKTVPVSVPPPP